MANNTIHLNKIKKIKKSVNATSKETAIATIKKSIIKWPSPIVTRSEVKNFTGGLYSCGYLANCDSFGVGPEGAFKIGRQVCDPVDSLCEWLISKIDV